MGFYKILQKIMTERGLSIPEVARRSGLSDSTVRSIIVRKNKTVALEVAFKLAEGLGVPLEVLNGDEPKEGKKNNENNSPCPKVNDRAEELVDIFNNLAPVLQDYILKVARDLLDMQPEIQSPGEGKPSDT